MSLVGYLWRNETEAIGSIKFYSIKAKLNALKVDALKTGSRQIHDCA
jgi:hypothetical protein